MLLSCCVYIMRRCSPYWLVQGCSTVRALRVDHQSATTSIHETTEFRLSRMFNNPCLFIVCLWSVIFWKYTVACECSLSPKTQRYLVNYHIWQRKALNLHIWEAETEKIWLSDTLLSAWMTAVPTVNIHVLNVFC